MEFGFDYYEFYQGRIQDFCSLVFCWVLKQVILESNFIVFYLVFSREEVRGVGGVGVGEGVQKLIVDFFFCFLINCISEVCSIINLEKIV